MHGRLAHRKHLLEVSGQEVPGEVMILVAVGAEEDDPLDVLGSQQRLQRLDVDEVLL